MDPTLNWDFTLANYGPVWSFMVQLGLLLLFMMLGNMLKMVLAMMLAINLLKKHMLMIYLPY